MDFGRRQHKHASTDIIWNLNESQVLILFLDYFEAFTTGFKPNLTWQGLATTSRNEKVIEVEGFFGVFCRFRQQK